MFIPLYNLYIICIISIILFHILFEYTNDIYLYIIYIYTEIYIITHKMYIYTETHIFIKF